MYCIIQHYFGVNIWPHPGLSPWAWQLGQWMSTSIIHPFKWLYKYQICLSLECFDKTSPEKWHYQTTFLIWFCSLHFPLWKLVWCIVPADFSSLLSLHVFSRLDVNILRRLPQGLAYFRNGFEELERQCLSETVIQGWRSSKHWK